MIPRKIQKNKLLVWLFSKVYSKWLWYQKWEGYPKEKRKVIAVKGWRTLLVEDWHGRQTITPCFWWLD
jgi:hypothetical protein